MGVLGLFKLKAGVLPPEVELETITIYEFAFLGQDAFANRP